MKISIRSEKGEIEAVIFDGQKCTQTFPFSAEELFDLRESINTVMVQAIVAHGGAPKEVLARQRIQAAAPELLESLRGLLDWARDNTSPRDANSPHELLVAACMAIDKAEGQS